MAMRGGHHRDQLLLVEHAGGHPCADLGRTRHHERQVQLVAVEHRHDHVDRLLVEVDAHPRVHGAELLQHRRNAEAREGKRAEGDAPAQQPGQLAQLLLGRFDLVQHAIRALQEDLPRLGQLDPAGAAREELGAQLGLEPPDLLRQCRLRDPDLLAGPGEVPVAGDGCEVLELSKLHEIDSNSL